MIKTLAFLTSLIVLTACGGTGSQQGELSSFDYGLSFDGAGAGIMSSESATEKFLAQDKFFSAISDGSVSMEPVTSASAQLDGMIWGRMLWPSSTGLVIGNMSLYVDFTNRTFEGETSDYA